jgi:hypothetical protein
LALVYGSQQEATGKVPGRGESSPWALTVSALALILILLILIFLILALSIIIA